MGGWLSLWPCTSIGDRAIHLQRPNAPSSVLGASAALDLMFLSNRGEA